jgi:hypothetical protein
MKISGATQKTGVIGVSGGARRGADKTGVSAASAGNDQVQLSGLGKELSARGSAQRVAKLSELTSAVSAGGYGPEANLISASIIENSLVSGAAA